MKNFHHIGRYESNCHFIEAKVGFNKKENKAQMGVL